MSEGRYRTTAKGQRHPADVVVFWDAGEYVLLVERYTPPGKDGAREFVRGDELTLGAGEAERLGNVGAIASPDSPEAERARAERGTRSSDVRS